jgi:hypothetical protein
MAVYRMPVSKLGGSKDLTHSPRHREQAPKMHQSGSLQGCHCAMGRREETLSLAAWWTHLLGFSQFLFSFLPPPYPALVRYIFDFQQIIG